MIIESGNSLLTAINNIPEVDDQSELLIHMQDMLWRKFIDCYTGYPNSVSDIRIFRNSDIFKEIEANKDDEQILIVKKHNHQCLVSITIHSKRSVRTFSLLFGRFRRSTYLDMTTTNFIPTTIIACCVLHNLSLEDEKSF
ncbi:uncharacterized protein LOC135843013 [Planococcus citri]|uniref:uncharacterized protein LOC135843013 n=1 Tax=Planococcus citri TaxID=170843 RepID=UPI0031F984F2